MQLTTVYDQKLPYAIDVLIKSVSEIAIGKLLTVGCADGTLISDLLSAFLNTKTNLTFLNLKIDS